MLKIRLLGACVVVLLAGCTLPEGGRFAAEHASELDGQCIQQTGTRIRSRGGECAALPGRVYLESDLRRTGAPSTAEALRMLDPSIALGR
jgi:hypothetical protein